MKSVLMAYLVLVLHVALLAGLGLLVLFFRGVVAYMLWIFVFGAIAIALSGYLGYRRLRTEGRGLREVLSTVPFQGRPVEISFLRGLASLRVGGAPSRPVSGPTPLLEDPGTLRERELSALVHLLENDQISWSEYRKAKDQIRDA